MKATFNDICNMAAAIRCLKDGQSVNQVAASAKVSPQKVRGWVRQAGYRRVALAGQTKYLFAS